LGITFGGFVYFQGNPSDDLLNDFSSKDVLMDSCRLFLSLILVFKSPLLVQPAREMTVGYYQTLRGVKSMADSEQSFLSNLVSTSFVCVVVMLLTILLPQLSLAMGLLGSTSGSLIAYIAPAIMLWSANRRPWNQRPLLTTGYRPPFWLRGIPGKIVAILTLAFGLLVTASGFIAFIAQFTSPGATPS